ncbi:MAG: XdhC/CoxI family protein [Ilumatobacter sp.]|uniref:XdhC family protein n=1 Tax=Ilumatobacter sp. TaxID=1967498 RepID=UPI002607E6CE|nr:XdhC/CoxI family protein [Ilumatobacter sp.]MDJ0767276.1 XdhC/CoxI family protein [Ilumatobacter sp.]
MGGLDVYAELAAAIGAGEPVVLATVVRTNRSVPRHAGAKMLIYQDGRTNGTVGGGEMEARVRAEALASLGDGRPRYLTFPLVDPASGDPGVCGGEVELYVEPQMPPATLFVIGAGHVGKAVVELADWMGYRTAVWDDRPDVLGEIDRADTALGGTIDDAIATVGVDARTSIVLVTRNVALDLELLPELLATPADYIGVMGSRRRWATTREALLDAGVSAEALGRVTSPIGIDIAAETPEEIAVSIMAEVVERSRAS